jgi:hypothetical protein
MTGEQRWNNVQYYACTCGDPSHYLHLWIDDQADEDIDWDVTVSFGWHYIPLGLRLRYAWRVLRGQPTSYGSVILDLEDAQSFSEEISSSVELRRDNRQRK